MEEKTWAQMMDEKIQILDAKLTDREKSRYNFAILKRLIQRADQFKDECGDCISFQEIINSMLEDLNNLETADRSFRNNYTNQLNQLLRHYREDHKLVDEGFYKRRFLIFGMILGVSLGLALGNIAIGIGAGIAIGVGIGAGKDKEAEREKRIL